MDTPPNLSISPDKLNFIITKAREFDAKDIVTDPGDSSNAADDGMLSVLEDHVDDPTYQELRAFINTLTEDEQIDLVALTWLGRGDYSKEEWREALEEARRIHDEKETDYLIGTPLLADYLEEGLSQLGYSLEDFEIGRM